MSASPPVADDADLTSVADALRAEAERTFRGRTVVRDGAVVGFWHVLTVVREVAAPARMGRGGLARRGPEVTWCEGLALRFVDGQAVARAFHFRLGMDDEEVDARAMAGAVRAGTRPLAHSFGRCVAEMLREQGRFDGMLAPGGACVRHLEDVDRTDRLDGLRKALGHAANARIREQAKPFLATLDAVAVAQAITRTDQMMDGPWWGIDASRGRGAPLLAALEAHPRLRPSVLAAWARDPDGLADAVTRGDEMEPIARAAMAGSPRPDGHGRDLAIAEASLGEGPEPWAVAGPAVDGTPRDLAGAFRLVTAVAGRDAPRDPAGWSAALALSPTVAVAREMAGRHAAAFLDVGRDWVAARDRLTREVGDVPLATSAHDLRDVARAFHRQLLAPAVTLHARASRNDDGGVTSDERDAGSLLWSGSRLRRCLYRSALWHARRPALEVALSRLPQGESGRTSAGWGAGLPDHVHGGIALRVLTDEWQLRDEGNARTNHDGSQGLAHCVGGYGPDCRSGRTRILSVRRLGPGGTFERLSTAQVSREGEGFVLRQHRGSRNQEPCAEAREAVTAYVNGLNDGTLKVNLRCLTPSVAMTAPDDAGYDWSAPDAWSRVSALWQPYLPRTLRGLSPADWHALDAEVADIGDDMAPIWRPEPWTVSRAPDARLAPNDLDASDDGPRPW